MEEGRVVGRALDPDVGFLGRNRVEHGPYAERQVGQMHWHLQHRAVERGVPHPHDHVVKGVGLEQVGRHRNAVLEDRKVGDALIGIQGEDRGAGRLRRAFP